MSREQRWRYRDSLDFSWMSGEVPGVDSESQWMSWLGYTDDEWKSVRHIFMRAFKVDGDTWTQKRLHDEFLHATDKSRKAVESVGKRWDGHRYVRNTTAIRTDTSVVQTLDVRENLLPTELSPITLPHSPEKTASEDSPPVRSKPDTAKAAAVREWRAAFEKFFWPEYPRKTAKGAAAKAWDKLLNGARTDDELQAQFDPIIAGLDRWKEMHRDDDPQFIPHASTWLNQRRYEDQTT
jgi:uncharacterized protein YdaU (DUF1376 family)